MDGIALFSLGQPSPGVCRLFGKVNGYLQEGLHQRGPSRTAVASAPSLGMPLPSHTSTGDPPTLVGGFGSVSYGVPAPFLWVLVHARLCALKD